MTANLALSQAELRVVVNFISSPEHCMEALGMDLAQQSPNKNAWWETMKTKGEDSAEKWIN